MGKEIKNSENGRIIGGIILVGAGVILLLKTTGIFFPEWLFSWPMILILVGIYSAFKQGGTERTQALYTLWLPPILTSHWLA